MKKPLSDLRHRTRQHSTISAARLAAAIVLSLAPVLLLTTGWAQGQTLYVDYGCAGCHGYEGQGTVAAPPVPRLAPTAYPYEAFAALVRTPPRVMPAYSPNVLSDEQLQAIFDYVASIPESPAVEDIPALRDLL